jgi:hypothetical protein
VQGVVQVHCHPLGQLSRGLWVGKWPMRRFRLRVHAEPGPKSVVVGWDPGEHRYVADVVLGNGTPSHHTYEHLREVIFRLRPFAVMDDLLLRELLNDRGSGAGGGR